jgi:hypothetical protein
MTRSIAALALVGLFPGLVGALEIVNLRPCYGPQGVTRPTAKVPEVLPGDTFYFEYTVDGLDVNPNTNKVSFLTKFTFSRGKDILFQSTPKDANVAILDLGGTRISSSVFVNIGADTAQGMYTIELTVTDTAAKKQTSITQPIKVLPVEFGFAQVDAVAANFVSSKHVFGFSLVGHKLDAKKMCNVEGTIRVLDAKDKPVGPKTTFSFPAALPGGGKGGEELLPFLSDPIFLNRPGQFTFEVTAIDRNNKNKQIQMRLPLTVLDAGALSPSK